MKLITVYFNKWCPGNCLEVLFPHLNKNFELNEKKGAFMTVST